MYASLDPVIKYKFVSNANLLTHDCKIRTLMCSNTKFSTTYDKSFSNLLERFAV